MDEQQIFRERLASIGAFAEEKQGVLTEQEIRNYFGGITLADEQWDMVYRYLETLKIRIAGRKETSDFILMPETSSAGDEAASGEDGDGADDVLELYLEDMRQVAPAVPGEEEALVEAAAAGKDTAVKRLAELYLYHVIAIAREYAGKGSLPVGDLIQEGNVGLLTGISMLADRSADTSPADYLIGSIREAMELYILELGDQSNIGKRVEEKVNHLHQAIQELECDLERKVTKEEVSAFLNMPLSEIEDLLRMAGDGLELE
ncbi:MAG TPA: hypothetical protein DF613_13105 [Lachnospiraceae bacterium]|nr:hypothetical protein [Lachnospiraceae bacterium]